MMARIRTGRPRNAGPLHLGFARNANRSKVLGVCVRVGSWTYVLSREP